VTDLEYTDAAVRELISALLERIRTDYAEGKITDEERRAGLARAHRIALAAISIIDRNEH
jgi:hypothetical protein